MERSKDLVGKTKSRTYYFDRKIKKTKENTPILFSVGEISMMTDDEHLNEFMINNPNSVSYNFMIYGILSDEEISLLSRGLFVQLESYELEVFLVIEIIDEEKAKAFDTYQGMSLSFLVASTDDYEELIRETITGGFQFLRFKGEYLGRKRRNVNV